MQHSFHAPRQVHETDGLQSARSGRSAHARARALPAPTIDLRRLAILLLAVACLLAIYPAFARADIGPAGRVVPSAALVGEGRLTFLGFRIFDAELYAPAGTYSPDKPFALKLTYLRAFTGKAIAEQTAKEMKRQGMKDGERLDRWIGQLEAILPNVSKGQSITGVRDATGNTVLYAGNRKLGTIRDTEFTRRFFGIWLGRNTNDQGLRNKLVGARS
ncbi:chalcone isomerase family protein [Roseibium sp.]|uniref:chalcone isomerase family protein n=1 Tax=Roseibium sp. TaxID=1936156 RepID=UPI003A979D00